MTEAEYQFKLDTFAEFLALGPQVWRNWATPMPLGSFMRSAVKDRCFLSMQAPDTGNVKAALKCFFPGGGAQGAIGGVIIRPADRYELLLAPHLAEVSADARKRILLHELVHIGYGGHGKRFRTYCKAVGGVISGSAVTDPGFHLEKKVGTRFKRMRTFSTEKEAMAWFQSPEEAAKRNAERAAYESQGMTKREAFKQVRWRMIYG